VLSPVLIQSSTYGKCVLANYQSTHKDMCATEFLRLKDCYLVSPVVLGMLS